MPNSSLDATLVSLLRPLARILLRQGVTAHEFSRWSGAAFVAAAGDLLAEQGAEASFSRISSVTGLHRHSVSELHGALLQGTQERSDQKEYQRNRLARVLTGWFEDPAFTDRSGRPSVLPFDGSTPSFVELARAYSGDIYPRIILDELVRVGAVRVLADGRIRAVSRRYTPGGTDPDAVDHSAVVAGDVLRTLEHNMGVPPERRHFEDAAIAAEIDITAVPMLRRLLERRGAAFLDDVDGWLTESAARRRRADTSPGVRAGVRVLMVVDTECRGAANAIPDPRQMPDKES